MQILTWNVRNSKGLTLAQMAKITGISKTTLNDIENGKISPRMDVLEKIASSLDIHIIDLFESKYK